MEELHNIPMCEFYCRVALDTVGPLLETKRRNKYLLVAIDHYSKLVEAKAVTNHDARLTIDNKLAELCEPIVDDWSADQIAEQMVNKVNLISSIHVAVLTNIEEAKKKQKHAYAAHKGKQFFEGFAGGQFGEDETSWKKEGLGIIVGRPPYSCEIPR
jgi:hypothetical protein